MRHSAYNLMEPGLGCIHGWSCWSHLELAVFSGLLRKVQMLGGSRETSPELSNVFPGYGFGSAVCLDHRRLVYIRHAHCMHFHSQGLLVLYWLKLELL